MQNVALVDTLLKHGGDPNLTWTSFDVDSTGVTKCPLLVAVCNGNSDIVTLLLNAGADVNDVSGHGQSVVWHATTSMVMRDYDQSTEELWNKLSTVRLLLEHGADVNTLMPDGISPLYIATSALAAAPGPIWRPEYRTCVIELLKLMVKYRAELHDSRPLLISNVLETLTMYTFVGEHHFIVELFRAGTGLKLLEILCVVAVVTTTIPTGVQSINLCQAAVLAGYASSAGELQMLQLAAARDNTSGHLIQQLMNWLNEDRQQVPSLLRQCRVVIRRLLSAAVHFQSILPAIDKLPLPTALKLYLQFDGPLSEVDLNVSPRMPTRP